MGLKLCKRGFFCVLLALSHEVRSRDFGTTGHLFSIQEKDILLEIKEKLLRHQTEGTLEAHNDKMLKVAKNSILRPKPVEGLSVASEDRTYFIDPSITVPFDLKDHRGRVFQKKGTRVNPLNTVSFRRPFIFFDGDNEIQKQYAFKFYEESGAKAKLILIKGSPLEIKKEWMKLNPLKEAIYIYFDQYGKLTQKFKFKYLPAIVSQEGKLLKVQEVALNQRVAS